MKKLIIILTILFTYKIYAQTTFGVTPLSKIYIGLLKQDSSNTYNRVDGAAIAFSSGFTNTTYGPQDALKFGNSNDNLYISDKGKSLSIDGRLPATDSDKIQLCITNPSGFFYQLQIDASNYISNGISPYIKDNYTGNITSIGSGIKTIDFKSDSNINSYSNRFLLCFKNDTTLLSIKPIIVNNIVNNNIVNNNDIIFNTYPNPVINTLHIQPNKYMIGYSIINIFSLSSKLVLSKTYVFNKNIISINLDNISQGEYILQIVPFGTPAKQVYSNHKTYTKTFIK